MILKTRALVQRVDQVNSVSEFYDAGCYKAGDVIEVQLINFKYAKGTREKLDWLIIDSDMEIDEWAEYLKREQGDPLTQPLLKRRGICLDLPQLVAGRADYVYPFDKPITISKEQIRAKTITKEGAPRRLLIV